MKNTNSFISTTIITFNEERNIERCLKSLLPVSDEIIIIDSFSTDNTLEICARYGAKIFQHKFEGYGSQKQFASSQATYNHILSIDADEELSPQLISSILAIKDNWTHDSYSFNRRNYYCNKPIRFCGWYPDRQVRLYNRLKTGWNDNQVHEFIAPTDKHVVKHINGDLNHFTCNSIIEHQYKEEKYARLNADILINKKKRVLFFTPYLKGTFRFFKTYILKLGLLDGYYGWMISKTLAKSSFYKYYWAYKTHTKI